MKYLKILAVSTTILFSAACSKKNPQVDEDPEPTLKEVKISIFTDFHPYDSIKHIQYLVFFNDTGRLHIEKNHTDSDFLDPTFTLPEKSSYTIYGVGSNHSIPKIENIDSFDCIRVVDGDTIPVLIQASVLTGGLAEKDIEETMTLKRITSFVILDCWGEIPEDAHHLELRYTSNIKLQTGRDETEVKYWHTITDEERKNSRVIAKAPLITRANINDWTHSYPLQSEVEIFVKKNEGEILYRHLVGPAFYSNGHSSTGTVISGNLFSPHDLSFGYQVGGDY